MRSFIIATALIATGASAQILGGAGGSVGGTVGAMGQSATGSVGAQVSPLDTGPATATVRDTTRTTRDTVRATNENARATLSARDRAAVRVEAGASMRVDRGSRCYYDDYYYDPVYRDGYYYCERSGTRTDVGVTAGVTR